MKHVRLFGHNAATRADVVVTIAALGLVVPLVVAALQDTGEQARVARCLSNLGHMMRATHAYFADTDDGFPLYLRSGPGANSWVYGGQTSRETWRTAAGGALYFPVTTRGLNPYVLGAEPQPDVMDASDVAARTPMPQFECPSGHRSYDWLGTNEGWNLLSSYDDIGTSYHANLQALSELNPDPWDDGVHGFGRMVRALIRSARSDQANTLVWFMESPLCDAYGDFLDPKMTRGYHGRVSWHTAGYFDGHADYRYMDTRGYCGPGWAAFNTAWVRQQGQPRPPISYISQFVRCDPITE